MTFNPNLLDQQSVRTEQMSERVNFGKANFVVKYKHFVAKGEPIVEVDEATFATLPVENRIIDLTLEIDTDEPGFDAPFKYSRLLKMGSKDWHKIFKKSVEALFGAGSMNGGKYGTTLSQISGRYVEVSDVEITYTKDNEIKTAGYPQIVRIFNTRDECLAAKNARFAKSDSTPSVATATVSASGATVPAGYTAESWASIIPMIKQELAGGKSPAAVAGDYGIQPQDIPLVASLA